MIWNTPICIDNMVEDQFALILFSKAWKYPLANAKEEMTVKDMNLPWGFWGLLWDHDIWVKTTSLMTERWDFAGLRQTVFKHLGHAHDTLNDNIETKNNSITVILLYETSSHSMKPTLKWWGSLFNKQFSLSASIKRARRSDVTTFEQNKQISFMPVLQTRFKVKKLKLE